MQQLLSLWRALSPARKAIILGSTVAIFLAVLGMSRIVARPNMSLLYSGLDPAAAGEVIEALQQQSAIYDVRGNSIFVATSERDQLRLTLASNGLPARSGQGYELLDSLTGFGTTSQMFDAAYLRAKEGELARTIVSSPDIATARVHIATGSDNPFRRDLKPSASVHVTGRAGAIDKTDAQAIRHLVAAAVSGLNPDDVSIIDSVIGLLSAQNDGSVDPQDEDRADLLRDRALRLIEARVGRGNAVVEVSVDTVTDAESIVEQQFDPNTRFVISSDSEERSDQSENSGSGAVTVASNLPDGDANGAETETSQRSETRERLNYEVSQTTREIVRAPGAIKRLTVAVLVNEKTEIDAQGAQVAVPTPEDELSALRDLVASAVGFDETRGDVITVRSMAFEPSQVLGSEPTAAPWFGGPIDTMSVIQLAVLAVVVLVLALFVVRPLILSSRRNPVSEASVPALPRAGATASDGEVLTGTIEPEDGSFALPVVANTSSDIATPDGEDPVARLKALIEERRSETVEVLRNWLDEPQTEKAR
ncbi:flagellar basal-body MS-ring/collar protein FliF [Marivita hallyeonensis]|uniref:Flagellar M-ring protein n=1 Tax=Marivita hallyeonensis TaxID=996342 RepID=A0A1M5XU08_9RHOB|nr:flagellar basal-body MS-ring/collar protein FliF [Marivita hallyeonensis]SHI03246.1 flagellar M-ring protein FliF [Marivita hallyeonensis]